jgi:TonB-dependent starch-binding outer membrane protein SusC
MKKKMNLLCSVLSGHRKTFLIMRVSLFLILLSALQLIAGTSYSQSTRLSLNMKNSTVKDVLGQIEERSEFYFLYNNQLINVDRKVDVNVQNEKIEVVLNKLFEDGGVSYVIRDRHIILTPTGEVITGEQQKSITGKVSDIAGLPLPGVSVVVKGSTTGTITDVNGRYSIQNTQDNTTLLFSFVGMKTQEIEVNKKSTINVTLLDESIGIEEVIAVGYGVQKKADLSSAIATLTPNETLKVPGGFQAGLQSSVAGVQVTGDKIRIRGVGSINNTDPLYVVDGMIGGSQPDENNIESIQILKDAASCAIYGARGANGVILITTKRGLAGDTKIEYNGYAGLKKVSNTVDMLNGQQLAELINEEMYNANPSRTDYLTALSNPSAIGKGYNMLNELFHTGNYQKHNLSVSGGTKKATFRINGTYSDDVSFVIKDNSKNYAIQFLSDFDLGKVKIGESFKTSVYNHSYSNKSIVEAEKWSSTMPIYDPASTTGFGGAGNGTDLANTVATSNFNQNDYESLGINGNAWLTYEIIKGLKYKFNFGVDMNKDRSQGYTGIYYVGQYQSNPTDDLSIGSGQNNRFLLEHTLSYDKAFGKHSISALAGITSEESKYKSVSASASSFPSSDLLILNLTQDASTKGVYSSLDRFAMYSVLGRVNYSYEGKYLLTANFRRDGSSNFGASSRYGNFPSFSGAWRVSSENFMRSLGFISDLKLRASYGKLGNSDIAHYQYQSTVSFDNVWYYLNGVKVSGALPTNPANPDVKWESQYSKGIGLDLSLLKNAISFTFDYFDKKTEDMLVNVPISFTDGYIDNFPVLNKGSISNKGIEALITYRKTEGRLNYSVSANLTTVKNKVLSLGSDNAIMAGGVNPGGENVTRTAVGHSIGQFWGYETDGLYKTQAQLDADKTFAPNAKLGDIKFKDLEPDGALNDKDKTFIGNPIPKFSYGFVFDASYKLDCGTVDFSMTWQGSYGNDIYNNTKNWGEGMYHYYNDFASTLNRYRAEELVFVNPVSGVTTIYPKNTDTDIPRAVLGDPNKNRSASSRYVEDGSYLRLKSLTLGYTLPKSATNALKIDHLRFYIGGKNLLTFTKYSGFDPEVASENGLSNGRYNLNRGIDGISPWGQTYPVSKEFFVGLQLGF